MSTSSFTAAEFRVARDPWKYLVASGLTDATVHISATELLNLHKSLPTLDEYHLAFALVVGMREDPVLFSLKAAPLLAHESMSVRLNAYNLLRDVPDSAVTNKLRAAISLGLSECPEREKFADLLPAPK